MFCGKCGKQLNTQTNKCDYCQPIVINTTSANNFLNNRLLGIVFGLVVLFLLFGNPLTFLGGGGLSGSWDVLPRSHLGEPSYITFTGNNFRFVRGEIVQRDGRRYTARNDFEGANPQRFFRSTSRMGDWRHYDIISTGTFQVSGERVYFTFANGSTRSFTLERSGGQMSIGNASLRRR